MLWKHPRVKTELMEPQTFHWQSGCPSLLGTRSPGHVLAMIEGAVPLSFLRLLIDGCNLKLDGRGTVFGASAIFRVRREGRAETSVT